MRVLGLIGSLPDATSPLGLPRPLALLRLLADAGHDTQLVVGEPLDGARRALADAASTVIGGPVTAARGSGTDALRWALPLRLAAEHAAPLARQARALIPAVDVIISFDPAAHGAASVVSSDIPTVMDVVPLLGISADGDWARTARDRWLVQPHRSWEKRVLGRGMGVLTASTETRQRMDRLYYRRPEVIPTPVTSVTRAPATTQHDSEFGVAWFGDTRDPAERAGLDRLAAELWPLVGDPRARLVIADAAADPALSGTAALPGAERVHPDAGLGELAERCTIAIRPIWQAGGDGRAALALMAAGLPVVGTPQAFEGIDMHGGMEGLVAATPSQLAIAIRKLAADPASTQQIAGQGQQLVLRRHAPETVGPMLEHAVQKAIERYGDYVTGRTPNPLTPKGVKEEIEERLQHARAAGAHERLTS